MKKIYHVLLLLTLISISSFAFGNLFKKKASDDKTLTIYTAIEDDQLKQYLPSFKKQYPDITLNIVRDSTGVMTAKLLAEKDNPQADLVWGLAATSLLILDSKNMLEAYAPKGVDKVFPEFKDSRKTPHWVGIDVWETGVIVNTIEIKAKGLKLPESYADLIKPEYKGLITMPHPASSGTGFLTVSAFIQLFGEKKAWEYMEKLHNNIAVYTHSGSKPAKMAGTGEYPVGISFGYRGIMQKSKGEPVETIFPKEGAGWDLEANALMKKKEIKEAAKLFLDWAISKEAMDEYNKNYSIITVPSNNPIPVGYPKDGKSHLIKNDLKWAAKNRDVILAKWDSKFGAKAEKK